MAETFTKEQEAFIEHVAWKVGEKLMHQVNAQINIHVRDHQRNCPEAKKVRRAGWIMLGLCIGFGVGGGGIGFAYGLLRAAAALGN